MEMIVMCISFLASRTFWHVLYPRVVSPRLTLRLGLRAASLDENGKVIVWDARRNASVDVSERRLHLP